MPKKAEKHVFRLEDLLDWADPETQCRVDGVDPEVVEQYAATLRLGDQLPDIKVVRFTEAGEESALVVDGFHTLAAMVSLGIETAQCSVVPGSCREDALWQAAGANRTHGLQRTIKDKQLAVARALAIWPTIREGKPFNAREIARHVGVSHWMVNQAIKNLEGSPPPEDPSPDPLLDKSGSSTGGGSSGEDEERGTIVKEATRRLRVERQWFSKQIERYRGTPSESALSTGLASVIKAMETLKARSPVDCPRCEGEGCDHCSQRGWVLAMSQAHAVAQDV